jgi:hypothetical protein
MQQGADYIAPHSHQQREEIFDLYIEQGPLTDLDMLEAFKAKYGRELHEGSLHARRNELMDEMRVDDTGQRGPSTRSTVQIIKWGPIENINAEQMKKNYVRRCKPRAAIAYSLTLDPYAAQAFLWAWSVKDWNTIMIRWPAAMRIPTVTP